jgi:hypothetical protein
VKWLSNVWVQASPGKGLDVQETFNLRTMDKPAEQAQGRGVPDYFNPSIREVL